jgi:hypothetical protein
MEFSGEGVSVYAEAKGEYTRQLCQFLTPALQKYFLDMLDIAKERETDAKKHLLSFQTLLEGVSEWNNDKVQRDTQNIAITTQCDYLEELLTAVFIAHTKVLSAIRLTNTQKKLQITIPKLEHFLHRTLIECARLLWTNTFLFTNSGSPLERQKNMRQIESLITEGVLQGVRSMLPVKSILREYLNTHENETVDEHDEEEEEEEEEEKEEEKEKDEKEEKSSSKRKKSVSEVKSINDVTGTTGTTGTSGTTGTTGTTDISGNSNVTDTSNTLVLNEMVFNPKDYDLGSPVLPSKSPILMPVQSSKSSIVTVQKELAPADEINGPKSSIPTIVLDGKPHVEFNDVDTFFSNNVNDTSLKARTSTNTIVENNSDNTFLNSEIMEMDDFTQLGTSIDEEIEFEEL